MQREKPPEWREKQKGSRGIRRGQRYRLVFQFPIRELAINGYASMNAIKRQEIIDADHQRLRKLIWPEDDWK
ncbi:hypothetical protein [Escherichia coli]|uniref:hypothetical protein n=1 Tax=Escherichia coli TaxID=562 RepID=UPI00209B6E7D|nr:hypothetical protein [Escherichia coli]MCO7789547.1 hypothetical protein [Escherichia coli]